MHIFPPLRLDELMDSVTLEVIIVIVNKIA